MSVEQVISESTEGLRAAVREHVRSVDERNGVLGLGPSVAQENAERLDALLEAVGEGQEVQGEELRNRLIVRLLADTSGVQRDVMSEQLLAMIGRAGAESRTVLPSEAERWDNAVRIEHLAREMRQGGGQDLRQELLWRLSRQEIWSAVVQEQEREQNLSRDEQDIELSPGQAVEPEPGVGSRSRVNLRSSAVKDERSATVSDVSALRGMSDELSVLSQSGRLSPQVSAQVDRLAKEMSELEPELSGSLENSERGEVWVRVESMLNELGPDVVRSVPELRKARRLAQRGGVPGLSGEQALGRSSRIGRDAPTQERSRESRSVGVSR